MHALTGIRFFLAVWVILHHLTGHGQYFESVLLQFPHPFFTLIRGGYLAVTTFFVLSGFVLTRTYTATNWNRRSLLRYGLGRVARVYPVYLLSLVVVAPFIVADHAPAKMSLVAEHLALIQGWFGSLLVGWNTPAWSLSCEMFFYLAFPLAAVWMYRSGWGKTLATAAAACCLTRVLWAVGVSDGIKPLIHFSDFLMGIAASCAYDLLTGRGKPPAGMWLYLPGCAAAIALITFPQILPGAIDLNSALRPLNAVSLIGFGLGGGALARALSSRLLVYLGKSSYAMYILHVPLMWWCGRWSGGVATLFYFALVIGVSALVYKFFEEPANRYLRSRMAT